MADNLRLLDEAAHDDPLFRDGRFDSVVGTATRMLIARGQTLPATLLANGDLSIRHLDYDDYDGRQTSWRLYVAVPVATFCDIDDLKPVAGQIDEAVKIPAAILSDRDHFRCEIVPELERDPDWRKKAKQSLSGEGITNKGRVHSENVAAREYDNLRFRSRPEIFFIGL